MHKSWWASLFSLEHSFAQIIIFFYSIGLSDLLIACFTLCYANEINLCHVLCAMCLAIITRFQLYNNGFTYVYHVLINCIYFVFAKFLCGYISWLWLATQKFLYMKKFISSYLVAFYRFWAPLIVHHWICAFVFTHILWYAHIKEQLILYWSSRCFVFHFGICCQWGRSLEGLR